MARKANPSRKTNLKPSHGVAAMRPPKGARPSGKVPSPLMLKGQIVIVKDLLGSFSEQTGASFG
jgi:hypothetical protein